MKNRHLLLVMFATLLMGQAWAYDFQSGDLCYNITSDSTVEVTYEFNYWDGNDNYSNLTTAIIPEGVTYSGKLYAVTSIKESAFNGCKNLTDINVSGSVEIIGSYAFNGCKNLKYVTISESVKSIRHYAFNGCCNLTSISIPNSMFSIEFGAFDGCDNLQYNEYDNALYLGNDKNPYLWLIKAKAIVTSCEINSNCKYIFDYAFYNTNLTSINIPESVTNIGNNAFGFCRQLTNAIVPKTTKSIGEYAFYLVRNVMYNGEAYGAPWGAYTLNGVVDGDFLFADKEKTKLMAYLGNDSIINIPNTVIYSAANVFDLDKVKLNKYENAYYLGNTENPYLLLTGLDYGATSCEINSNCKIIGCGAFRGSNLTSIIIPEGVKSICEQAFIGCNSLTRISIPNSIKIVEMGTFASRNLQYNEYDNALYLGNDVNPYVVLVKAKSTDIDSCRINNNCHIIDGDAFTGCYNLSLDMPKSVSYIGIGAFCVCNYMDSIIIPDSATIDVDVFIQCNINTFSVGNNTYIKYKAIRESKINKLIFDGYSTINSGAFSKDVIIDYVISTSAVPPTLMGDPFPTTNTVYVPSEYINVYKAADIWKNKEIKPYKYNIVATSNDAANGSTLGSGCYMIGEYAEITAIPKEHCHFVKWNDGNGDLSRHVNVEDSGLMDIF